MESMADDNVILQVSRYLSGRNGISMRKDILMRTNLFVCIVIVLGFVITSFVSYHSNRGIFKKDVERVSALTSEGIYHNIDSIFTKPMNVSLTMANDSLLKNFLSEEQSRLDDSEFINDMRQYLYAYKEKYSYDSVFLVSAKTNRYYHFNGLDRILTQGDPENVWYYNFLKSDIECSLNIDNDEAADNEITIFINCKIKDAQGNDMGVVGVGFRVDYLQELLREYEAKFDMRAYLVDGDGTIEVSTDKTGYHAEDLFLTCAYPDFKERIISEKEKSLSFWYSAPEGKGYVVTQYVPNLDWYLIVDNDTTGLDQQLAWQLFIGIVVIMAVVAFVLFMITRIIRKYNAQIIELTVAKEQEHKDVFQAATEQLYENIYELDITHNRAASESTEHYFESLGVPRNTPYEQALHLIAQRQIKEEYRDGYISTFKPANVLAAYEKGIESLTYDFMITNDGKSYYWMRITARIFRWNEDNSVRMFIYRQNIDAQKRQERQMLEQMQRDSLSGLYNKAATQQHIQRILEKAQDRFYAFFILDIDNFKLVNDTNGHAYGDMVIAEFADMLKRQFRAGDIVGRIGGDEYAVFVPVPSEQWAEEKADTLVRALRHECSDGERTCQISTSIGVAMAPRDGRDFETLYRNADAALYETKKKGKDGYTVYCEKKNGWKGTRGK